GVHARQNPHGHPGRLVCTVVERNVVPLSIGDDLTRLHRDTIDDEFHFHLSCLTQPGAFDVTEGLLKKWLRGDNASDEILLLRKTREYFRRNLNHRPLRSVHFTIACSQPDVICSEVDNVRPAVADVAPSFLQSVHERVESQLFS